ncbi:hypothetical protein [Hathewaya massiliensis]|uniref:hypothetical protein n=1 Tax=Hathewaya massiliensis TaxID=1964382 RepID=UPI00115B12AD|nr:hypothetical protein [Hathewaya massiliensis]
MKKIVYLLIVALLSVSLMGCSENKEDDLNATIIVKAQEAVKGKLKAPSTAKFPASFEEYQIKEVATGNDDIKEYAISSNVDAENETGAKIRNRFVVKLQLTSDMKGYKILDVKLMND